MINNSFILQGTGKDLLIETDKLAKKLFSEFSKIAKLALFSPCMKIKKSLDQMYSFDVVNNSPL